MSERGRTLRIFRALAIVFGAFVAAAAAFSAYVMTIDIQDEDATLEEKS